MGTMAHEPAPCTIKSPVMLQVGDVRTELSRPGVAVMDVVLPHSQTVDLQEIVFKNYYTAFLTLRVLRRSPADHGNESPSKWVTCLRNYCLMPNPHTEEGSQNYYSLCRHQSPQKGLPAWLSHPSPQERPRSLHDRLPDADKVSSEVQQMWVLTEMLQASQPAARIGRFDVDGSYELNLLSYT
ncbi:nicolin-1 isoform X2 [Hemicordylus capensis]|uniref:nicolin-1 isoform X2 n=1 Tax=Hemicordylus capensis TaxID=884348 RepID=UPI002304CD1F|nr:nicolin-1 isoform X2 [Hemicordylus capensis]